MPDAPDENPIDIFFRMIDPVERELVGVFHEKYQGSVRVGHSQYNWGATDRCVSQAVREDTTNTRFIAELGTHVFDLAAGSAQNIYEDAAFVCDLFGQQVNYKFTFNETELSGVFRIPSLLELNLSPPQQEIHPGFTLEWNQEPGNEIGVFIFMSFFPFANVQLPEVQNGAYSEEVVWYTHSPDDGSYTFDQSDFPNDLPDGAILAMKMVRGNYEEISKGGEKYILFAHTEAEGFVTFSPQ